MGVSHLVEASWLSLLIRPLSMTKDASNGALGISQSAANGQVAAPEIAPFPNVGVPGYPTFLPQQPQAIGSLLSSDKFPQNKRPPKLFEPLTIRGQTFHNRAWVAPMCQCKLHPPRLSTVFGAFVLMWDCADSSDNGHATDHHFVHLGSMAMRGWGLIMVEATAVVPEGRISPEDSVSGRLVMILPQNPHSKPSSTLCTPLLRAHLVVPCPADKPQGIWDDSHIAGFKRIVDFVHAHRGKIGIQLAHAGRKASTLAPWVERMANDEGWDGGSVPSEQVGGWPNNGEPNFVGTAVTAG